jgi:hypothetical protein
MPTSFTIPVESGEITSLSDFAMSTARAFGPTIAMREMDFDAPMTDENLSFNTEGYAEDVEKAKERLAEVAAWTPEEADEAARKHNQEQLKQHLLYVRENRAAQRRYGAMLVQVEAWIPPTADHISFKQYMIDQLEGSAHDSNPERPEKIDGATLRAQEIESAVRKIEFSTKRRVETDVANASRISWVRALEASLVDFEPVEE